MIQHVLSGGYIVSVLRLVGGVSDEAGGWRELVSEVTQYVLALVP